MWFLILFQLWYLVYFFLVVFASYLLPIFVVHVLNKAQAAQAAKKELASNLEQINGVNTFIGELPLDTGAIKDIAFQLKAENAPFLGVFASRTGGKPTISVAISDDVVREKGLNAGAIIREIAVHIKGGGGGQPFFATAGGKDESGIPAALDAAKKLV